MPSVRIDQLHITVANGDPASVRHALSELPAVLAAELRQPGSATSTNPIAREIAQQVATAIRRRIEVV